jgi:hypothetical protein
MQALIPLIVIAAIAASPPAMSAKGKNRYASELIEEGYQLCEQQGVEQVTITVGETLVVIDCEETPEPNFPGADDERR